MLSENSVLWYVLSTAIIAFQCRNLSVPSQWHAVCSVPVRFSPAPTNLNNSLRLKVLVFTKVIGATLLLGWKRPNLPKLSKFNSLLRDEKIVKATMSQDRGQDDECYDQGESRPIRGRLDVHYLFRGSLGWSMKQRSGIYSQHGSTVPSFHKRFVSVVTGGKEESHGTDSSSHMNRAQPCEDGA